MSLTRWPLAYHVNIPRIYQHAHTQKATSRIFELLRAEPSRFLIYLLDHSTFCGLSVGCGLHIKKVFKQRLGLGTSSVLDWRDDQLPPEPAMHSERK
jgi:hypothetical protein